MSSEVLPDLNVSVFFINLAPWSLSEHWQKLQKYIFRRTYQAAAMSENAKALK